MLTLDEEIWDEILSAQHFTRWQAFKWLWENDPEAKWFWLKIYIFTRANLKYDVIQNLHDYGETNK